MESNKVTVTNLVLLVNYDEQKILLAMKKRGFGAGRWNGYGGKVKGEESIEGSAVREIQEEANVALQEEDLKKVAHHSFYSPAFGTVEVHTYIAEEWEGEAVETEEMRPEWYSFKEIPYKDMWQDDKYWLPEVLKGRHLRGEFWFDKDDNLLKYTLNDYIFTA
ncbi:MAG TPA: 8-oxo-dGTP diphosphatase [Patescibacteria group bacterium]